MRGASCATCSFSETIVLDPGPIDDGGPSLICRRYPPVIVFDGVELTKINPQVEAKDWCGEHDLDAEKAGF